MSERSGQTAKGKDGKAKYASLNLFDTYKGKSLEAQKPVVPARHGLQSLGKVASARRMPPPASLPSLKAENKGNDPNVTLVPKDGTGWASKQEPADPKSTDVLSAAQPESPQPVVSQTPAPTRSRTPPAPEAPAPALAQGAGARSWAQASVTHGAQGDGGKGSNQPSPFSREEFPTLQAAGDQDRAGREQATADQLYGPGPSLRPQNVTSWRDGGGRGLAPTEGVAEGGSGGVMVMEGAFSHPQQNSQAQGPPRNPPAGSPALPLPQPPVGPGFPQYRGMMPPFMYPPYLPFPPPYGPQGPYRFPPPGEAAPRFSRSQGGPDGRPHGGPRGEVVKRPSILKQNDLKELDELDHDGDEGWAGPHEEIDYSAKLKFSDDEGDGEEDGDEDRNKTKNGTWEQQRSPDGPPLTCRSRASDSGGDSRHTPPSSIDSGPPSTPGKPGWTEEGSGGGVGWVGQGGPANHQERPQSQLGSCPATQAPGKPAPSQATPQPGGPVPPPQPGLLAPPQGEDEDETWRQRRKQSSSEISAAVERARRRREEEERRMEEERRAACAEKLKRLDEKHQQQGSSGGSKTPSLDGNSMAVTAGSPSPSLSASASSPNVSQPVSPCVDPEELPLLAVQQPCLVPGGSSERQRASSNSSYDSNTGSDSQQCTLPPAVAQQQQQPQPPVEASVTGEGKDETLGGGHLRSIGGGVEPVKVENMGGGAGRQASGPPGQGYSKYQKSLPPRFQRQQQEQLLKQQQWQQQQQQQQQQHSQASQGQLPPQGQAAQAQQQGPSPGSTPQPGPGPKQGSGGPLYQGGPIAQGNMGRPPPLPMNFDPRWMMMPYMDPRMMQGRPPPMDYYAAGMHPSGMMGRERSDSGGSGSDPFDRQQHPGHPHRGTPPMDPKLAWGPEVFPGGGEGRGLTSPLRQKQPLEEDDMAKGPRSDTPPHRHRDGGPGPIQQPSSGPSNQNTAPVSMPAGGNPPHHHHHPPYMGGRGNYSNFPEQGSRMAPHQQQQRSGGGERGGMGHQEDGPPRGSQQHQGQIWGAPHPHYDRNGRAELSPLESNSHQQQHAHHPHGGHQQHPAHTSHCPLHSHKPENGRERAGDAPVKKAEASSALHQPSISSSCSSSSSSSSAREDGSGKTVLQHHLPPQREAEIAHGGSGGHAKQDKAPHSTQGSGSSLSPAQHGGHAQVQQQPHHPKNSQRGREHKTETQWGPRPGNNSNTGGTSSSHNRRVNSNAGVVSGNTRGGDDSSNMLADHKVPGQSGGSVSGNKRAGPIKRPVQKDMKREGAEGEGSEKPSAGKEMEQDSMQTSKQDALSATTAPFSKDEPAQPAKSRNGRERGGGSGRGPKVGDNAAPSLGYSRRERERSLERGGGGGTPYHHGVSARGSGRVTRGRGGEFYGRGRGYRGGYVATANAGSASRGRASGRSGRDYRSSTGSGYQEFKSEVGGSRHGPDRSQHNPARARNRSETRSEGSEYEEIPKRRRQRGSETGSESAASDLAQSDKEDRKPSSARNGSENAAVGSSSATPLRGSQARVFTPRGVPSRRGRGGGGGGGIYRGAGGPMAASQRSAVSTTSGWSSKTSTSVRKPPPLQSSRTKDMGRGGNGGETKAKDKAELITPTLGSNPALSPQAAGAPTPQQSCAENGVVPTQLSSNNSTSTCSGPNLPLSGGSGGGGGSFPPSGFERPPRRRRHGRSQHQQDKPPRFRRLKERENAARINGSVGVIGGGRPSSPSLNSAQDTDGAPTMGNANHTATTAATNNNNSGSHLGNANSHHHHHYSQGNTGPTHHHNHNNPAGGAKSPDFSNQNSDQANEEWETASESSDFTEFREREGGGGGGKSYSSHHHHHPQGRGAGGGGGGGGTGEREMTSKESAANKRSFSSQRPGMERQNRRVNTGGGGGERRGPRGPPGGGTGGGGGNGGGNRSERRGNWPSPKNRK